jgi:putative membrane protein
MTRMVKTAAGLIGHYLDVLLFGLWLGMLCWLLLTDTDKAFLHPRFRPFLVGGGILLAAFMMAAPLRSATAAHRLAVDRYTARLLLLMAPLLFLTTVAGQGMGAHALTKKYSGMEQQTLSRLLERGKSQSEIGEHKRDLSLLEIARRMKQMNGRRVVTEGLVYRPDIMPKNFLTLFRFAIFCCAADALPVWVFVEKDGVAAFDDEDWIRVEGTVRIVNFNGTDVPVIKADTIVKKSAPAPGKQYLFF